MSPRVMEAIQNNQMIEAIKACRDSTSLGLAEAREYVEEMRRNQNRR
jgi:ribosomal protein L7/L12